MDNPEPKGGKLKFSIVIPAHDEERNIGTCITTLLSTLEGFNHEIVVVNDGSRDGTLDAIKSLGNLDRLKIVNRPVGDNGFGKAVKAGFAAASGDYVALMMADLSDDPADLLRMISLASTGKHDVIIGNRFKKESVVTGYPGIKLVANRLFNIFLAKIFGIPHGDISNAFKMYKRDVLESITIESDDFDITIEIPLKAWILGKKFVEIPNNWYRRKDGSPKWKLLKAGMAYVIRFIAVYRWKRRLEKSREKKTPRARQR